MQWVRPFPEGEDVLEGRQSLTNVAYLSGGEGCYKNKAEWKSKPQEDA